MVLPTSNAVSLLCIMRDYIRPDDQFQWFKEDKLLSSEKSTRYTVLYLDGLPAQAQNGQGIPVAARVSVLTISQPNVGDAGLYTCRIDQTAFGTVEVIASGFGESIASYSELGLHTGCRVPSQAVNLIVIV